MHRLRHAILAAVASATLALPQPTRAQHRLPIGGDGPSVHLELAKPFFGDSELGLLTGVLDAGLAVPLESGPTLFAMLAIAHGTIEGADASSLISNPRVGVILGREGETRGELYVDLPFAKEIGGDDYAVGVAIASDPERLARYNPDAWTVGGTFTPASELESGAIIGVRLGAEAWIPTESGPDTELIALYAGFARSPVGGAVLEAELSGFGIVSESEGSLGERTFLLGTFTVGFPEIGAGPELFLRLPIDDGSRSLGVDATVGLRLRLGG